MVNCQEPVWVFQSSEPSLCFLTPSSQPNPTTLSHRTCMFISSLHPAWAGDQLPTCSKHLPNSRIQSPEVLAGPDGMSGKASEELETSQSLKPPWNLPRSDSPQVVSLQTRVPCSSQPRRACCSVEEADLNRWGAQRKEEMGRFHLPAQGTHRPLRCLILLLRPPRPIVAHPLGSSFQL